MVKFLKLGTHKLYSRSFLKQHTTEAFCFLWRCFVKIGNILINIYRRNNQITKKTQNFLVFIHMFAMFTVTLSVSLKPMCEDVKIVLFLLYFHYLLLYKRKWILAILLMQLFQYDHVSDSFVSDFVLLWIRLYAMHMEDFKLEISKWIFSLWPNLICDRYFNEVMPLCLLNVLHHVSDIDSTLWCCSS